MASRRIGERIKDRIDCSTPTVTLLKWEAIAFVTTHWSNAKNTALRTRHNYTYQAFATLTSKIGDTQNQNLFGGERWDEELGNYYLRDRYYDSQMGRFIRRDTYEGQIANPITMQRYIYANGNPVSFLDPTGQFSIGGTLATIGILATLATTAGYLTVPSFSPIGDGISQTRAMAIETNVVRFANRLALADSNGNAMHVAELMSYAAIQINPTKWMRDRKTRADYLRIISDVLTGDGFNWFPMIEDSPARRQRPSWLNSHDDDPSGWWIYVTPDEEDGTGSRGVTGRRDHFIANANAGAIARDYQTLQQARDEERSRNDMTVNALGRNFGIGVVITQTISQYAIRDWLITNTVGMP
jgi:RHS repeat-associated protein